LIVLMSKQGRVHAAVVLILEEHQPLEVNQN